MRISDDDDFLRSAFHWSSGPKAPDVERKVRRRIRRKRSLKRAGIAFAGVALAVGIAFIWNYRTQSPDSPTVAQASAPESPRLEPEASIAACVFAAPPVHSLDQVTHQRDAYVLALKRLVEE